MTVRGTRPTGGRHWRVFWASWAALSILASLWALATPIGASPDEPAHIVKAASVVRGEFIGEASTTGNIVHVPQYIAWTHAQTCYAFDGEETADCSPEVPGDPFALVESRTTAGLYNPVYYLLVGWPSLFDTEAAVYGMRVVSAVLSSLFLALSFMLVRTWRRPALPTLAIIISTTPMLLFLAASVNPNAVETTAILAVLVAMVSIVREPDPRLLAQRSAVLMVAGIVAVNARGLSPIWLAVAVIAPLLLISWRRVMELVRTRAVIAAIAGTIVGAAFALIWLLRTNSLAAAVDDPEAENLFPGVGQSAIQGFLAILERTFGLSSHLIGLFGWMDTPAPISVIFVWTVLAGSLVVASLCLAKGRELGFLAALVAAFVLLPPIIQGAYVTGGGYIWQGRYNFPMFVCMLVAAAAILAPRLDSIPRFALRRGAVLALLGMAVAHAFTFAFVLRRYSVGIDSSWREFLFEPEWSAPGGNLVLIAVYGIALLGSLFLALRELRLSPRVLAVA